jgi:uncharacterized protein YeaO (DUF488 family)
VDLRLKRAYDPPSAADGARILVDRLWPRGIRKDVLRLDLWLKEIAPSPALRTWFAHDPARFDAFRQRYRAELAANPDAVGRLQAFIARGRVSLVYATRDPVINSAAVLRDWLLGH